MERARPVHARAEERWANAVSGDRHLFDRQHDITPAAVDTTDAEELLWADPLRSCGKARFSAGFCRILGEVDGRSATALMIASGAFKWKSFIMIFRGITILP